LNLNYCVGKVLIFLKVNDMETILQKKLQEGKQILISEIKPPACGSTAKLKSMSGKYKGKVCALGVSDNREEPGMSSLAASCILAREGMEPIMHMVTRDRNRIALVSDCLGAQGLGIGNLLLTSGTHQTLGCFAQAKSVFDIDSIQLTQALNRIDIDAGIIGKEKLDSMDPFFIGGVTDPFAEPVEMQILRLHKKIKAGARFIITAPVYDLSLFNIWWDKVCEAGIPKKTALIVGIKVVTDPDRIKSLATSRPDPKIPGEMIETLSSSGNREMARAAGIDRAVKIIAGLSEITGIRGFAIDGDGDDDAVLEVIDQAGLGDN
jgi:methylenetetrahydrofolate reductase (NADPH)